MLKKPEPDVARLKKLLFDEEQHFIDQLADRLHGIHDRTGDDEKLRESVARVISGALRDAEVDDHDRLASAMAPVVVATIQSEIVNSRDTMVEALYPITGQLVSAYVANAFKDLLAEINQRLESGLSGRRLYLRVKSAFVGRPYSELVLAELNAPRVEELFLVRRESGELIDRWQAPTMKGGDAATQHGADATSDGSGKEHLVSGFLSAITDFAREAFQADAGELQTLDVSQHRIYLRVSPAHLIAAKCRGVMPAGMEHTLDEIFLAVLDHHAEALGRGDPDDKTSLLAVLPDFAHRLQDEIGEHEDGAGSGNMLAVGLLSLVVLALAGWLGWGAYSDWRDARVRGSVERIVAEEPAFKGFPVRVETHDFGRRVRIEGLAPSGEAKERLLQRVADEVNPGTLGVSLAVLPDLETARRLGDRLDAANAKLELVEQGLAGAAQITELRALTAKVDAVLARIQAMQSELRGAARGTTVEGLTAALTNLEQRFAEATAKVADIERRQSRERREMLRTKAGLTEAKEEVGKLEQKLSNVYRGLGVVRDEVATRATSGDLDELAGRLNGLGSRVATLEARGPSPAERLVKWIRANAIFFETETRYRDPGAAEQKLAALVDLLAKTSVRIRVIGYTDDGGNDAINQRLSEARSRRVASDLVAAGVGAARLETIGRADAIILTGAKEAGNANRRVQFELLLEGER